MEFECIFLNVVSTLALSVQEFSSRSHLSVFLLNLKLKKSLIQIHEVIDNAFESGPCEDILIEVVNSVLSPQHIFSDPISKYLNKLFSLCHHIQMNLF
jgi:hypothetical protein